MKLLNKNKLLQFEKTMKQYSYISNHVNIKYTSTEYKQMSTSTGLVMLSGSYLGTSLCDVLQYFSLIHMRSGWVVRYRGGVQN